MKYDFKNSKLLNYDEYMEYRHKIQKKIKKYLAEGYELGEASAKALEEMKEEENDSK